MTQQQLVELERLADVEKEWEEFEQSRYAEFVQWMEFDVPYPPDSIKSGKKQGKDETERK